MKERFKQLSNLSGEMAAFAKRELSSAQETLDKSLAKAVEMGNAAKDNIILGVDKSADLLQSAGDTELAKTVIERAKTLADSTVEHATKYTGQLTELTKKIGDNIPEHTNKLDAAADELNFVIDKLKGKDKVGVAGEALAAVGGAAGGVAAASTIASAAGASTLLGSTSLASVLGGVFVTATPVGWVIGSAVVAGAAGYGISKLVRSGGKQDHIREQLIKKMELRLSALKKDERNELNLTELSQLLVVAIEKDLISELKAKSMISLIENGSLDPDIAIQRLKSLIENIAI
jgi:hypothetical protein